MEFLEKNNISALDCTRALTMMENLDYLDCF